MRLRLDSAPSMRPCCPHAVRGGPARRRSSTASSGSVGILAHGSARHPRPHGIALTLATFRRFRTLPAASWGSPPLTLLRSPRLPPRTRLSASSRRRDYATLRLLPPLCALRGRQCLRGPHLACAEVVYAAPADAIASDLRRRPPHLRSRAAQPHHSDPLSLKCRSPTT